MRDPLAEVGARDFASERIAQVTFALVLLVLGVTTTITFRALNTVVASQDWVEHTVAVEQELATLSSSTKEAEATSLEFLITGDERLLRRLEAAERLATRQLKHIQWLTRDNGDQQTRSEALRDAMDNDFALAAAVVARREEGGLEAARALLAATDGAHLRETLNSDIEQMTREEETLFALRTVRASVDVTHATTFRLVLMAFTFLAVIAGFVLLRRNLHFRQLALEAARERKESLAAAATAQVDLRVVQASETIFRGLLEAAPDALVIVGADGRMVHVNGQAEKLFGYSRTQLLGQMVEMLIPERFRKGHPARRAVYFADPQARPIGRGLELCGRRSDGSEFPIELTVAPLQTEAGVLVSGAIRDITQRKITEDALKLSNEELEAFSFSVAHDLRSPLRGMNGFAQVLLDEYHDVLDAQGQDWLQEILLNARRMSDLVDALLSLARLTRSEVKPERVDLTAMAQEVAAHLQASEPLRVGHIGVQGDMFANVDPRLGRILLENLLGNAWKFTSKLSDTRIEFGLTESRGAPAFFVRDNGAGFDMAFEKKLFAPFHRLHTVAEFPGTGIGLATVQRILHRQGGDIWAEGHVGTGAAFYFTLPSRLFDEAPS